MMSAKTMLITGVSSGFGLALAKEALLAGHRVIGTVRSPEALQDFRALDPDRALGCLLDVTDTDRIAGVVEAAHAMLTLMASPTPPVHLLLGSDALELVRQKMAALNEEITQWEQVTLSTGV